MEAPPPVRTKLAMLRQQLAADLDSHLEFVDDNEAERFYNHCDHQIRAIQQECMRIRPDGAEREDIADFVKRAREHLQPLREHIRQRCSTDVRDPFGSDGVGDRTRVDADEELASLQRAERRALERARVEHEVHRREEVEAEAAILSMQQEQELHRQLADREASLRLVRQMSDVSPDAKRGLEGQIAQLKTDIEQLSRPDANANTGVQSGAAVADDEASLRLARELQQDNDRAVAAQIAAEEYGGADSGSHSRRRAFPRPINAGGGGGAGGGARAAADQLSQMTRMLDHVAGDSADVRGRNAGGAPRMLGWQAQMLEQMVERTTNRRASERGAGAWWEFEDEGQWISYDGYSAGLLESGFLTFTSLDSSAGTSGAPHDTVASSVQVAGGHLVDFRSMQQHDAQTGLVHDVRRREVTGDAESPLRARQMARARGARPAPGLADWRARVVRRGGAGAGSPDALVPENATYEQLLQLDERGGGRAAGGARQEIRLAQLDRLTALQVLSAEQLVVLEKNDDAECKICLEKYSAGDQLRRLPCQHLFHKECVDQHFTVGGKSNCPVCRHDLRG